jgi:hypothetical protein
VKLMEIGITSRREREPRQPGIVGKLFLSLFFLIFLFAGFMFVFLMGRDLFRVGSTYLFSSAKCVVEASSVTENPNSKDRFTVAVSYSYVVDGKKYNSEVVTSRGSTFSDYASASRLRERYLTGSHVTCYYNPHNPVEAILVHGSLWMAPLLLLPMMFILIGGSGIYGLWFGISWVGKDKNRSISDSATSKAGAGSRYGLALFFFVFFAIGAGIAFPLFIIPVLKSFEANSWISVPAVVESSRVKSHSDSDGKTYSVDILYSYQVNGRTYKSNQFDFFPGSSSGYYSKKEIVDEYPTGKRFEAVVNPDDPTEAVIDAKLDTTTLLLGLLPLIFVLIGLGGMYAAITGKMTRGSSSKTGAASSASPGGAPLDRFRQSPVSISSDPDLLPEWAPKPLSYETLPSGDIRFTPLLSPKVKIIGITIFAVIWNGVIGVVFFAGESSSGIGLIELLFAIPFVLVGLALIGGIFYTCLAAFNARPTLILKSFQVYPGIPFRARWELSGRTENIQQFSVKLRGIEEARYQRGTDTVTDRDTFYEKTVTSFGKYTDIRQGDVEITIPQGTMHSFESNHNEIKWSIRIHGEIKNWPDMEEEFPIIVMPALAKESRS